MHYTSLAFRVHQLQKLSDRFVGLQGVSQLLIKIQFIAVPATILLYLQNTGLDHFLHDPLHRAFGYSNLNGYFPGRWLW